VLSIAWVLVFSRPMQPGNALEGEEGEVGEGNAQGSGTVSHFGAGFRTAPRPTSPSAESDHEMEAVQKARHLQ
jgi:hypothetical protein